MAQSSISVTIEGQSLLAMAKTFQSGSQGYFASGKVAFGGEIYQCSINVVEVGSKPGSPAWEKKHGKATAPAAQKNGAVKAGLR